MELQQKGNEVYFINQRWFVVSLSQVLHHHNERNQAVRLQANVVFVLVAVEQIQRAVWGHERHITVWPGGKAEKKADCMLEE